MIEKNEFSRIFNLDLIKKIGTELVLEASALECEQLAKRFSIPQVIHINAKCILKKLSQKDVGDYCLKVSMNAKVIQQCVVTLNHINESINEDFSIIFLQKSKNKAKIKENEEEKKIIEFEFEDADLEMITQSEVDLGEYVAEYLSLSMSSYPRQSEVSQDELGFKILNEGEEKELIDKKNPFNVLASLKH